MSKIDINRHNLSELVEEGIQIARARLLEIECIPSLSVERRDLEVASKALELIREELRLKMGRPIGQRSAGFTRYVIDEEPNLKMDPNLKDLIVQIERFYQKY
jgi:hypothetical protein